MRLKLLLFARARELAGVSETSLEVEPGVCEVRRRLETGATGAMRRPPLSPPTHTPLFPTGATTASLQPTILAAYPALAEIQDAIVLAVNQRYVGASAGDQLLAEGDEVAVIPPISGG